jgi:hypothetical protein
VAYCAVSDTEGHFSIRVLRATVGKQRVRITGTPGNVYVKSMWLGQRKRRIANWICGAIRKGSS